MLRPTAFFIPDAITCHWLLLDCVSCRGTESCLLKERMDDCTTGSCPPSSSCSETWCRREGSSPSFSVRLDLTYLGCWGPYLKRWMKGLIHCSLICLNSRWGGVTLILQSLFFYVKRSHKLQHDYKINLSRDGNTSCANTTLNALLWHTWLHSLIALSKNGLQCSSKLQTDNKNEWMHT